MKETDLAWLAGIIDGEGNIQISTKKASNGKSYLVSKIRVSNCDMRMTKKISEIYCDLNLTFFYSLMNKNNPNWKTGMNIEIASQKTSLKLLKLVFPYLVNKQRLAKILIDLLEAIKVYPKGGNTSSYNYLLDEKVISLMDEYERERKWYFDPSTTTRRASSIFEFGDIV